MSGENGLSKGWVKARLEDICKVVMGQSPPSSTYNTNGEGLPFFQGKAEFTDLMPVTRQWCNAPSKTAEPDDILVSIRAPVGPTNLAPSRCCIGRGLAALQPAEGVEPRFVLYAMRLLGSALDELGTGTTFKAVSGKTVREFLIPVAPSPEQRRIVAKIEELFSDLDAGVAALVRVKANLKRYCVAVLKAAVEGRLTEKWRDEHPATEPASKLLERILTERRKKWEQEQLAKFAEAGKTPPKGWQRKYKEPAQPDTTNLPALPEGWCWASIDELASSLPRSIQSGPFGSNLLHSEFQDTGVLAIGIDNVLDGKFSMGREHRISLSKFEELTKYEARPLDVAITVMATVGRCCVIPDDVGRGIITKHLYRITADPNLVNPHFLQIALSGGAEVRKQIFGEVRGQTRPGINGTILKKVAIPLPTLAEQARIVTEVQRAISISDATSGQITSSVAHASRLRQSILKQAFEGKLVPQDPTDEPASILLERLRLQHQNSKFVGRRTDLNAKARKGLGVPHEGD